MKKSLFNKLLLISFLSVLSITFAQEQTQAPTPTPSPEKKELILKFMAIFDNANIKDQTVNSILRQIKGSFPKIIENMFKDLSITQPVTEEQIKECYERFSKAFAEKFSKEIDFKKINDNTNFTLYDKYFTETELDEMIKFYNSPAGKKSIETIPQLLKESMQQTTTLLTPKINDMINNSLSDEKELIKQKYAAAPTPVESDKKSN
ncbi:MAG: hypothetical protein ACD_79C00967G0006 [uncultured bacterium]|nr:MAG: hypothetical protein ACD_79C00967G0006 [uncultured bacterium]